VENSDHVFQSSNLTQSFESVTKIRGDGRSDSDIVFRNQSENLVSRFIRRRDGRVRHIANRSSLPFLCNLKRIDLVYYPCKLNEIDQKS
jgi:hypothetical protein